jgi:3-phosphoshikimate 1-carboxyvinyltransferase
MIDYTLPLDRLPDPLPIEPLRKPFDVTITPPGSKSITCRAYVLAALASGESKLMRPLRADDTDRLLEALCVLGAEARWDGEDVYIKGVNGRFPRGGSINLGDGGTPTRFMIACACLAAEPVTVDGSERMRERPIAEGVEMLRQLGAKIEYVEADGRLPVRVTPRDTFVGGEIEVGQTQSSQFISAMMLIASCTRDGITLTFVDRPTSATYAFLTHSILTLWGNDLLKTRKVDSPAREFWSRLDGDLPRTLKIARSVIDARTFQIEPDASSAAYWFLAAWLNPRSRTTSQGFGDSPIQPDMRIVLELRHANLIDSSSYTYGDDRRFIWEVSRGRKTGKLRCDCSLLPDGSIGLIACGASLKGKSRFTGLRTLRVKETDRIAALANELRKVGCGVETGEDWIEITPAGSPALRAGSVEEQETPGSESRATDPPIVIETYNDHRMAMAFAVLGLAAPNGQRLAIRNPACVAKSYPTFWTDFAKLYQ